MLSDSEEALRKPSLFSAAISGLSENNKSRGKCIPQKGKSDGQHVAGSPVGTMTGAQASICVLLSLVRHGPAATPAEAPGDGSCIRGLSCDLASSPQLPT